MRIAEKLKELIAKKGGTPPAKNNIAECLDCLCACDGGGGGGGIAGKTRIYGDRFDKYLYHDEDLTKKMSAAELDALMNSTGVLVLVPGENSDTLVFPVSYRFNADIGCRLGLWQDGSVYLFMTKEAASGPM